MPKLHDFLADEDVKRYKKYVMRDLITKIHLDVFINIKRAKNIKLFSIGSFYFFMVKHISLIQELQKWLMRYIMIQTNYKI